MLTTKRYARDFQCHICLIVTLCFALIFSTLALGQEMSVSTSNNRTSILPDKLWHGTSVYPQLMPRDEFRQLLKLYQKAHFNLLRVGFMWGNNEPAEGQFNFEQYRQALDDIQEHNMQAIVITVTCKMPSWLPATYPEVFVVQEDGIVSDNIFTHGCCLSNPVYRKAVQRYVRAMGLALKDHPALIGWQLDNEIEHLIRKPCFSSSCKKNWHDWLKKTYHTIDELNDRMLLASMGEQFHSFEQIPLTASKRNHPIFQLAYLRFRRDLILGFLAEQKQILREAGAQQWIMHDWVCKWLGFADDPQAQQTIELVGLNFYHPTDETPKFWKKIAWHMDKSRSANRLGYFLVTETTIGSSGSTITNNPVPYHDQFRMWMLQPMAFGACGIQYWCGRRWHGGYVPHWGSLTDWTGQPEPDFEWVIEIGEFLDKWSDTLLKHPVKTDAVVLTDFDQRSALYIYEHLIGSKEVVPEAFDLLHRLGIGTDTLNSQEAQSADYLNKYSLVVIPAATALDNPAIPAALKQYVEQGGNILITPFTAYQNIDGIFRKDGLAANLSDLTGVLVRTIRRMGPMRHDKRHHQQVAWKLEHMPTHSAVGQKGFCELMEVASDTQVIATFDSEQAELNGRPAATRKRIEKGSVIKLACWPRDDSVGQLMNKLVPRQNNLLSDIAPKGVQAVPRTDDSLFIINTTNKPKTIQLSQKVSDLLSNKIYNGKIAIPAYGVYWLK